jgi:hypothetical protein
MRSLHLPRILAGSLLLLSAPALAQNLVANSGFDTDITSGGWQSYGSVLVLDGTRSHDALDAAGSALSGSARMSVSGTAAAGTVIGLSQCVDVSGEAALSTYKFFASVNGTAPQNPDSRAVVEASFFTDTACATPLNVAEGQGGNVSVFPAAAPPWQTSPGNASAGGNEGSATAPAGANGLQVRIYLERISGSSLQEILFDTVVVHNATTTPVLLTTFAAE